MLRHMTIAFALFFTLPSLAAAVTVHTGDILVTDQINNRLLVVNQGTGTASILSPSLSATTNGLKSPMGMAVAGDGTIYVVNWDNNSLISIDPATGDQTVVGKWVTLPPSDLVFQATNVGTHPSALEIDSAGDLYVAAQGSQEIRKITGPGSAAPVSTVIATDPLLQTARGISINAGETKLHVAATTNGLLEVDISNGTVTQIISSIPNSLSEVAAVAHGTGGEIYFTALDWVNSGYGPCVLPYAGVYRAYYTLPFGQFPGGWFTATVEANDAQGNGPYDCPQTLEVLDAQTMYVTSTDNRYSGNPKVLELTKSGSTWTSALFSDFNGAPLGPTDIAIAVPEPGQAALWTAALGALTALVLLRRRLAA